MNEENKIVNEISCDLKVLTITTYTFDRLQQLGESELMLYMFYVSLAQKQETNRVYATNYFIEQRLNWGHNKIDKVKASLARNDFITYYQPNQDTNKVYTQVHFLINESSSKELSGPPIFRGPSKVGTPQNRDPLKQGDNTIDSNYAIDINNNAIDYTTQVGSGNGGKNSQAQAQATTNKSSIEDLSVVKAIDVNAEGITFPIDSYVKEKNNLNPPSPIALTPSSQHPALTELINKTNNLDERCQQIYRLHMEGALDNITAKQYEKIFGIAIPDIGEHSFQKFLQVVKNYNVMFNKSVTLRKNTVHLILHAFRNGHTVSEIDAAFKGRAMDEWWLKTKKYLDFPSMFRDSNTKGDEVNYIEKFSAVVMQSELQNQEEKANELKITLLSKGELLKTKWGVSAERLNELMDGAAPSLVGFNCEPKTEQQNEAYSDLKDFLGIRLMYLGLKNSQQNEPQQTS